MKYILIFCALVLSSVTNPTLAKDSVTVHIFLLDDCVICQDYSPKLNQLYEQYGDEISFIGYFPNFSSKTEKIEFFKKKYNIQFPLKTDYYKTQAARFQASITPEVIIYNHDTQKVLYRGRIDNRFFKLGKRRHVITSNELEIALSLISEGKEVKIPRTEPIGCYINYADDISKYQLK